jgi:hypothetical protein
MLHTCDAIQVSIWCVLTAVAIFPRQSNIFMEFSFLKTKSCFLKFHFENDLKREVETHVYYLAAL